MSEDSDRFATLPRIPADQNTWRVAIDGKEIDRPQHVVLWLDRQGRPNVSLTLGWIDDGTFAYDGLSHCEWGGGATIIVPFVIYQDELYIAVVSQFRYLTGDRVDTVPRGYTDVGRSHSQQARVESREEMGRRSLSWPMFPLDGEPMSNNTSLMNTRQDIGIVIKDGGRPGARFFAREIDPNDVERNESRHLVFKPGVISPEDEKENLGRWELLPWHLAVQGHDACVASAAARLMAHLRSRERMGRGIFFSGE